MDYRYGSHTVFQIGYHFVWVTKYRYKVPTGDIAERVRAWSARCARRLKSGLFGVW